MSDTGTGKRVDEAILKLANDLSQNAGMQDWLQSTVQEHAKPCFTFCQWMGLEVSKLDKELWKASCARHSTMWHATGSSRPSSWHLLLLRLLLRLCSNHKCSHSSINLLCSPGVHLQQQMNRTWQPGPSTEFQHQRWPPFNPNLSALNTSGLSSLLDLTGQSRGPTSSMLSPRDDQRPGSWVSSTINVQRASTSDVMRTDQHPLEPDQEQE